MMTFSRKQFELCAEKSVLKQIPESHREALDRKPVSFRHGDRFGITEYTADGKDWYLYPVYPEWCERQTDEAALQEQEVWP